MLVASQELIGMIFITKYPPNLIKFKIWGKIISMNQIDNSNPWIKKFLVRRRIQQSNFVYFSSRPPWWESNFEYQSQLKIMNSQLCVVFWFQNLFNYNVQRNRFRKIKSNDQTESGFNIRFFELWRWRKKPLFLEHRITSKNHQPNEFQYFSRKVLVQQ